VSGYPIPYVAKRFGVTPEPEIKAVKIAQANGKPSIVGSSILPLTAKVKPTSSIPAAPPGLPPEYDFCVQENGMILRARDVTHKLHGKSVLGSCFDDEETGLRMCSFDVGGDVSETVPACIEKAGISEPTPVPPACCFDIETSTLVCEGSPLHGLIVEMVAEDEVNGIKIASVEHPDLPGGGARMPICEPMDRPKVWDIPPPKRPPADEIPSDCCIDEETLSIVCADPTDPEHGKSVEDIFEDCVDKLEGRVCRIRVGSTLVELPACHAPPPPPPGVDDAPEIPCLCCFDTDTSTLLCEGTVFHGLKVDVVAIADMPDGTQVASVEHPSLPGGGIRAPMCSAIPLPEPTPEPRPEPVPMPEPYEDYGAGEPQPPPVTEEECIPSSIPHDFDTQHGHREIIDADSRGYGVGYRGQSSLPGMRGAGQGGGLRFGTDSEIQRAESRGYGVGHRGQSDLPGMRGAGQGEGMRFGTDHEIQLAESRGYGVGYRGQSDLPGMRGAGQGEGMRFGSGYANVQDRGYGVGYRGHSRYPGMRGAGQSDGLRRFAGFSGRPGDLEPCHGEWINQGPFKSRRDGWKPEMASLQQGGICCVPWGEVGIKNPPNISGDSAGYNTRLWQYQPSDHMMALDELGYRGTEEEMVLNFQADWNWVSQSMATIGEMKDLDWARLVIGNLISDGRVGPHTLNAIEIALVNQKKGLAWPQLVSMTRRSDSSECPPGRRFARTRKRRMKKSAGRKRSRSKSRKRRGATLSSTQPSTPRGECEYSWDCGKGQVCVAGTCEQIGSPGVR
jgi:hypothetical protein